MGFFPTGRGFHRFEDKMKNLGRVVGGKLCIQWEYTNKKITPLVILCE